MIITTKYQLAKNRRFSLKSVVILFLFFSIAPIEIYGQTEINWTLLEEKSGVKIFYYESACGRVLDLVTDPTILNDENALVEANKKLVLLRFENSNSYQVNLSWNAILRSDQLNQDSFLSISGLGSAETNCDGSPMMQLTSKPDDGYPIAAIDALSLLNFAISSN